MLEFSLGILGNLIAAEIYQYAPALAIWILRRAAQKIPLPERLAVLGQWKTEQVAIAGNFAKLGHALARYFSGLTRKRQASEPVIRLLSRFFSVANAILVLGLFSFSSMAVVYVGVGTIVSNRFAATLVAMLLGLLYFYGTICASRLVPPIGAPRLPQAERLFGYQILSIISMVVAYFTYATYYRSLYPNVPDDRFAGEMFVSLVHLDWAAIAMFLLANVSATLTLWMPTILRRAFSPSAGTTNNRRPKKKPRRPKRS
jgi:hypothetical protein